MILHGLLFAQEPRNISSNGKFGEAQDQTAARMGERLELSFEELLDGQGGV